MRFLNYNFTPISFLICSNVRKAKRIIDPYDLQTMNFKDVLHKILVPNFHEFYIGIDDQNRFIMFSKNTLDLTTFKSQSNETLVYKGISGDFKIYMGNYYFCDALCSYGRAIETFLK